VGKYFGGKTMTKRGLTLLTLLVVMTLLPAVVSAQDPVPPVSMVSATGNANSCQQGVPIANLTVRYNAPGEITLVTQAFSQFLNDTVVIRATAGGGDTFNTVVDAPNLPPNTLVSFTFTTGDWNQRDGVTVNCTTGEVLGGGVLERDGRFAAGDDMPLLIYPRIDLNNRPFLDFYDVVRREDGTDVRGPLLERLLSAVFDALPEEPTATVEVAVIGGGRAILYQLAGGGFQLNLAPDFEGKVKAVRFDGIPPTTITRLDFQLP
jgi:hypothetical protein